MGKKFGVAVLVLCIILNGISTLYADSSMKKLRHSKAKIVYESVYEVVVKKPFDNSYTKDKKIKEGREDEIREDPIIYEEEIPWDILPYSFKMDEYFSIGTAFAIAPDKFMTAAHVLELDQEILWDELFIRNKDGKVYEIDKILKYSNNKDFVVFTLKEKITSKYLGINSKYRLNTTVFAVGNAFGEGIVIRNGLLNSITKETENGEWDFLRFSAAASPGNSGGPLLNEKGEVIGIVLRKSKDENLNYALPILEVLNAKDNEALFHRFWNYSLLLISKKYGPEKKDDIVKLPLHYKELRKKLVKLNFAFSKYMMGKLLEKYQDQIFPNGTGSYNLYHVSNSIYFPHLAAENPDDGIWTIYRPKDISTAQLDNNGMLKYGQLSYMLMFDFTKPDNMDLKPFLEDSKLFMDTFLKAYHLNREFGDKKIRVVSLGNAYEKSVFVDRYNRKWIIESWLVESLNSKILCMSLPTPSGRIGFILFDDVHSIDNVLLIDMKEYLNYIFYSYYGTFKEWKDFFKQTEYIPNVFSNYNFSYGDDKMLFKSNRLEFSYGKDIFNITDESSMVLKLNYYPDNKKVIWDIIGISVWENKNDNNYISIVRNAKPEVELPEEYHDNWNDIVKNKYPFDRKSVHGEGETYISDLHNKYSNLEITARKKSDKIYTIGMGFEGEIEDDILKKKFDIFDTAIKIIE